MCAFNGNCDGPNGMSSFVNSRPKDRGICIFPDVSPPTLSEAAITNSCLLWRL